MYQQSSFRLSGRGGLERPQATGGPGRPEHEGTGGALWGGVTGWLLVLVVFSTSSKHWIGTVEEARDRNGGDDQDDGGQRDER